MGHRAAKAVRLQRMLVAHLMPLLCFLSLGFVDRGATAQEPVGQAARRMVMDLNVLTVEQEKAQTANPGSDLKECANGCPVTIVIPSGNSSWARRIMSRTGMPVKARSTR